jgi:hypothetical protein
VYLCKQKGNNRSPISVDSIAYKYSQNIKTEIVMELLSVDSIDYKYSQNIKTEIVMELLSQLSEGLSSQYR